MLTRLKVDGFKNLREVDLPLGPFTCVAGPNGVGKSNLFDAISFLGALADLSLVEAASVVRGGETRRGDVRSLFHRSGVSTLDRMRFEIEMIVPRSGEDSLGQPAIASMTFLRYTLELGYREDSNITSMGGLSIEREEMNYVARTNAASILGFKTSKDWRDSAIQGHRTSKYISTVIEDGRKFVRLHADTRAGRGGGRPRKILASTLPRTVLSSVDSADEHRTLVLAKQEMRSWTQLQLEPTALRTPDSFTSPRMMNANGLHLPATLYELGKLAQARREGGEEALYARVANRLSELIEGVNSISIDVDEKRQLLSVVLTDRDGTAHVASALSDGTLRFLALAVMEEDARSRPLICLEEPENGMHPSRIPAVIELLSSLVTNPKVPVNDDNPLRQVIVNTHSPLVVANVPDEALVLARQARVVIGEREESRLVLAPLAATWRSKTSRPQNAATRMDICAYLDPLALYDSPESNLEKPLSQVARVRDRGDLWQPTFPFMKETTEH